MIFALNLWLKSIGSCWFDETMIDLLVGIGVGRCKKSRKSGTSRFRFFFFTVLFAYAYLFSFYSISPLCPYYVCSNPIMITFSLAGHHIAFLHDRT